MGLVLALFGLAGIIYTGVTVRRVRSQETYQPVLEDWLWHVYIPLIAYIGLAVGAVLLQTYPVPMLFVIGVVSVLLVFIGIHNAWDTVTYLVIQRFQARD